MGSSCTAGSIDQADLDRIRSLLVRERATLAGHAVAPATSGSEGDGADPGADGLTSSATSRG